MPHKCGISSGSVLLLRQNDLQRKKSQYYLEIISCDPSIYAMDHLDLTVSNFMEDSIGLQRVVKRGIQVAGFHASTHDRVPMSPGKPGKSQKKFLAWKNH